VKTDLRHAGDGGKRAIIKNTIEPMGFFFVRATGDVGAESALHFLLLFSRPFVQSSVMNALKIDGNVWIFLI